ncbi:hypothetical protein KSS87_014847, partial [Heliosperma pusillum]
STFETYYEILNVKEDSSIEDIRQSYRSALLQTHPDKLHRSSNLATSGNDIEDKFGKVQKAWETLGDSRSRALYDHKLRSLRCDMLVADDVALEDMLVEDTEEVLEIYYQCRCGDYFVISWSELEEMGYDLGKHENGVCVRNPEAVPGSVILSCGSCSLKIRLLVNLDNRAANDGCGNGADKEKSSQFKEARSVALGLLATWAITAASPVIAAGQRLPPLSTEPDRCERAFVGNTIGQANGVYDKPLDLRMCDYSNDKSNLKGKTLSAALMVDAKFDGADMTEVVMSKAYAAGASFQGTDFTNAVLDRVNFERANLKGAIFKNTVLSGSTFNDAKLQDVVFEDTIIGYVDLQKLCLNKTINEDSRAELGCR